MPLFGVIPGTRRNGRLFAEAGDVRLCEPDRPLHHMKTVLHDLRFGQGNGLLTRVDIGLAHVHRNRFDRGNLLVGKLRKASNSALGIVSVGDRFNRAGIEIVVQRDVAVPLGESLFVEADSRLRLGLPLATAR